MPVTQPEVHRIRDLIRRAKEGIGPPPGYIPSPTQMPTGVAPLEVMGSTLSRMFDDLHYLIGLSRHIDITPDDVNVSSSERFVLNPGEQHALTVNVDRGEILLLKKIIVSDYYKNTYDLRLNDNTILESSEFDIPSGFLALAENAQLSYVITNNSEHIYDYILQTTAWSRRAELWDWSEIEYKEQMEETSTTE